MPELEYQGSPPAKIPADVDHADRVLFNLTARQAAILTETAVVLHGLFRISSPVVPTVFLADAMTGDGPLPAPFDSPIRQVTDDGVVDLGSDGATVLAQCSTVNFALRTPAEQDVLIGGFARWLNALTGPVQIACSSQQIQLGERVAQLRDAATGLPHPAVEDAAREHAAFLEGLAGRGFLLDRSAFLAVHEDGPEPGPRLARRADEAAGQLAACEIDVRTLTATDATAALIDALNPAIPTSGEGA